MKEKEEIDYTVMDSASLITNLSDDASAWATAFCQHAEKLGHHGIDEGWMIGWFANAIEHSSDVRTDRAQPSTSPVVVDFPLPRDTE